MPYRMSYVKALSIHTSYIHGRFSLSKVISTRYKDKCYAINNAQCAVMLWLKVDFPGVWSLVNVRI